MKEKQQVVVANFKMNLVTASEVSRWLENFKSAWAKVGKNQAKVVLCPQSIHLGDFLRELGSAQVEVGAQDCFWEKNGAFTGELSPFALNSLGAKYVILGHSERRKYFGESDERVNLKALAALKAGLYPVFCIGETAQEKGAGKTREVINRQLTNCLKGISSYQISKVIICYEPVWAISSNKPSRLPEADEIMQAKIFIKKFLTENYSRSLVEKLPIIYGGSVNSDSVKETCRETAMDGALVGSASLQPFELVNIIKQFN